ncbi:MAG TPA: hypothetical protein VF758_08340, partial [Candidatus Acidoferrum sp.]
SLSVHVATACTPSKPVSVLIMQGTKDPLVPLAGGKLGLNGSGGTVVSHGEAVEKWVKLDGCAATPVREHIPDNARDGTSVDVAIYTGCADGSEVRDYVVVNGGHAWPGGKQYLPEVLIGKTTRNLDASETIWEFFSKHRR